MNQAMSQFIAKMEIPSPHNLQLIMALVFSFLNFIPLFSPTLYKNILYDDYIVNVSPDSYLFQSFIAPIVVSLVPGIDLICDLIPLCPSTAVHLRLLQYLHLKRSNDSLEQASVRKSENAMFKETRLSISERICFLVGVLCLAVGAFPSYVNAPVNQRLFIYNAFTNTNGILLVCPILSFFSRCSTSWNAALSLSCGLFVCLGGFLSSLSALWATHSSNYNNLVIASGVAIDIAAAIYIYVCCIALYKYYFSRGEVSKDAAFTDDSLAAKDVATEEKFRSKVVAAHMAATFIIIVINSVWYWYIQVLTPYQLEIIIYISVASIAITFMIEFRVRKTEVAASLTALLDSKKSYVRYVSHELRTPVAVAMMGVNIAKSDLQKTYKIPLDAPVTLTLQDVEIACSSAVDILNDMLSFDKLESGALVLHKKPIKVVTFVSDCIKLFSIQCRQKNIELKIKYDVDARMQRRGVLPIVAEDEVMGDRSKLEQIIRNLVSNAITHSSAKSAVTLNVYYKPSASRRRNSQSTKSTLSSAVEPLRQRNGSSKKATKDLQLESGDEIEELMTNIENGAVDKDRKCANENGNLIIECVDLGAGISQKRQAKIFTGAVQCTPKNLQASGGSGYGLFISKGIAELHGGSLSVYSKGVGRGSTFTLALPMQRTPSASSSETHLVTQSASLEVIDSANSLVDGEEISFKGVSSKLAAPREVPADYSISSDVDIGEIMDKQISNILQMNEDHTRTYSQKQSANVTGSSNSKSSKSLSAMVGLSPEEVLSTESDEAAQSIMRVSAPMTAVGAPIRSPSSESVSTQSFHGLSVESEPLDLPPTYKLLAVDDSRVIRRLILKTMEAKGHSCDEAEDGVDGVNKVKAQLENGGLTYDAILMDFVMPNMDGPTATKAIRELGVTIPILGLTGNCLPRDVDWFKECGATAVMFKPLNVKEFDDHMKAFGRR